MKTLTVFTPTFNRAHTLPRLYESLSHQTCDDFVWLVIDDGSTDETETLVRSWMKNSVIPIEYIHKENGGLFTGYNTAYSTIKTELNVCIDSDDTMPEDAVEKIVHLWIEKGNERFAGIIGLDFDLDTGKPIGGCFPERMTECFFPELYARNIHRGDTKQVMRTALMKKVVPQVGFPGEKNFNPVYMLLQITDEWPILVANECFCLVQYQEADSMSRSIWRQYIDSPRSFAEMRRLEMKLKHSTPLNRFRSAVHYIAECILARDKAWLALSPRKLLTLSAIIPGLLFYVLIRLKNQ